MSDERSPLPEVPAALERGQVLLIAPHPDDDVLGAGGTVALHREQGDAVHVVIAYDGVAGDPDGHYPRAELRALRRREALAGGAILGLEDYEFWDYPEGHEPGPEEFRQGALRVAELVRRVEPVTVYAPWIGEHHLDHWVLARVVRCGLELAGFAGTAWGYEVWTPLIATRVVDISSTLERKMEALSQHESQLRYTDNVRSEMGINAHRSIYLRPGATYGEGFRPLGPASAEDRRLVGL